MMKKTHFILRGFALKFEFLWYIEIPSLEYAVITQYIAFQKVNKMAYAILYPWA